MKHVSIEGTKEREENVEPESNIVENENKEECNIVVVVEEIQGLIESAFQFGEYRRTQRKESHNLDRHFKHMLPLMEDLRHPVTGNGVVWLRNLRDALSFAKEAKFTS